MSADAKIRAGATQWQPQPSSSTPGAGTVGLPKEASRRQFPLELCQDTVDPDRFIGSKPFNFLADSIAAGEVANFSGAYKAGEVYAVEDITASLMNESVRTALAAEVSRRSKGKTTLRPATEDEIRGEPLKGAVHFAIERDGDSALFGVHEHGFEPHIKR